MNDHDTFHDLDARAARAAGDLRAAARARRRPAFDPERSPSIPVGAGGGGDRRGMPRRTLAAVAAAVVLVAAGVVWAANRPHTEDDGPLTTTTDQPRPFVLGSVPKGFSLAGAGEITSSPAESGEAGSAPLVLYGTAADDLRLGLTTLGDFDAEGIGAGADPFEVEGVEAYSFDGKGFGPRAVVVPVDGTGVLALAPSIDREELVGLLGGARIDGDRVVLRDGALPDGWSRVGEEPSPLALVSPIAASRGATGPGSFVAYTSGDPTAELSDLQAVYVSSMPGDAARLHAPVLAATEVRGTTIRGHEALVGTSTVSAGDSSSTTAFATWMERPGELIRLTAMGVPVDELQRIAEDVEPAAPEAWKDLVERTQLGEFDSGQYRESQGGLQDMARGRFDDGTAWILRIWPADGEDATGPGASLDLQVALGGDSTAGSSSGYGSSIGGDGEPAEQALGSSTQLSQGGRSFGAGFVGADVATVVLVGRDGTELGEAEIVSGLGRRAWVAEATEGVAEVVARAADGTELGRQDLGLGTEHAPTTVVASPGD
ncbi:MAG: hypothetical protein KF703_17255 [Actinobacteria bacterium]|nr:hypothetical protein [Actinomycetota bacterium]